MGLGVAVAIHGGHGTDPLATFWEGLSIKLPITVGQANFLVSILLIIISIFIDRKQLNIGTIINPLVAGFSTDLFLIIFNSSNFLLPELMQSIIGVILLGIGVGTYTVSNLGKGAYDAVTFSLCRKLKLSFYKVRMIFDLFFLIAGYALGGKIGIATIFAVLCLGAIIQNTNKWITTMITSLKQSIIH